jgi:hypothetical protein
MGTRILRSVKRLFGRGAKEQGAGAISKRPTLPQKLASDSDKDQAWRAIFEANSERLNKLEESGVSVAETATALNQILLKATSPEQAAKSFEKVLTKFETPSITDLKNIRERGGLRKTEISTATKEAM